MWRALFTALFRALIDAWREFRMEVAHEEALKENARRDAEARIKAGEDATRKRIRDAEMASDDPGALRDWLRARDPNTK